MALFKRVEVWVLLILGGGAALWVLTDKPNVEGDPQLIENASAQEAALVIHRCTLERDYGNARLDIELRYRNASPRPLILQPPDVKLTTSDGKEVPPFVLPVEKLPQIAADTVQNVRVRYWLDKSHLEKALRLEIRGSTAEIKSEAPLNLDSLENRKPRTWNGSIR